MAPIRTPKRQHNVIAVVEISSSPEPYSPIPSYSPRPKAKARSSAPTPGGSSSRNKVQHPRTPAPFPLASPPLSDAGMKRRPRPKAKKVVPSRKVIEILDSSDEEEEVVRGPVVRGPVVEGGRKAEGKGRATVVESDDEAREEPLFLPRVQDSDDDGFGDGSDTPPENAVERGVPTPIPSPVGKPQDALVQTLPHGNDADDPTPAEARRIAKGKERAVEEPLFLPNNVPESTKPTTTPATPSKPKPDPKGKGKQRQRLSSTPPPLADDHRPNGLWDILTRGVLAEDDDERERWEDSFGGPFEYAGAPMRVDEKEATQEPTPPAQNPTPPPAAVENDDNNNNDAGWQREYDADQLEAIAAAADAEEESQMQRALHSENDAQVRTADDDDDGNTNTNAVEGDGSEVVVVDIASQTLVAVLEIIPEVDPDHVLALVEQHMLTCGPEQVVQFILHHLFENPGYPRAAKAKAKGKGKGKERAIGSGSGSGSAEGKRKAGGEGSGAGMPKKPKIDYASIERPFTGGPDYAELALTALQASFPFVPVPYLRKQLASRGGLYAPTHLGVLEGEGRPEGERGYVKKMVGSAPGGRAKGKGRALNDEVFEEEKRWLDAHLAGGTLESIPEDNSDVDVDADNADGDDDEAGDDDNDDEDLEDDGTFIECGCCFGRYPFERMAQCPDAHLFCRSCLRTYASTQLGAHNTSLTCMHTSNCSLPFPPSELVRLLPARLVALYERLLQQRELKDADLEGYEECPFCEWGCVVEVSVEEDKVFRCGNAVGGCGEVSCRGCRRKEHLPRTCGEVEGDRYLDGRLMIEEAMTRALMRNCPKCLKAFIKENGCNKMVCTDCRTISCYVCRQVIAGYDHFHQNDPRNPGTSSTTSNPKCPLWDTNLDQRHADEVKAAYAKALEAYKKEHPEVEMGRDMKVDLPEAPVKMGEGAVPAGYVVPEMYGAGGAARGFGLVGALGAFRVAAGGGVGGGGGLGGGGLGGGPGGAGFFGMQRIPAVLPPHLDAEPLRRELVREMERERRAGVKVVDADRRLTQLGVEFEQLKRANAGMRTTTRGGGGAGVGPGVAAATRWNANNNSNNNNNNNMPVNVLGGLMERERLSAMAVGHAQLQIQVERLQADHRDLTRRVAALRAQINERENAAGRWRGEQVQRDREAEARQRRLEVEREMERRERERRGMIERNQLLLVHNQALLDAVERQRARTEGGAGPERVLRSRAKKGGKKATAGRK